MLDVFKSIISQRETFNEEGILAWKSTRHSIKWNVNSRFKNDYDLQFSYRLVSNVSQKHKNTKTQKHNFTECENYFSGFETI